MTRLYMVSWNIKFIAIEKPSSVKCKSKNEQKSQFFNDFYIF